MFEVVEIAAGRRRMRNVKIQALSDIQIQEIRLVPQDRGRYRRDVEQVTFHAGEVLTISIGEKEIVSVGDHLGPDRLFAEGHFNKLKVISGSELI